MDRLLSSRFEDAPEGTPVAALVRQVEEHGLAVVEREALEECAASPTRTWATDDGRHHETEPPGGPPICCVNLEQLKYGEPRRTVRTGLRKGAQRR